MKSTPSLLLYPLLLILISVSIYANTLNNDFVWDDTDFVVENRAIRDINNWPSYFLSKKSFSSDGTVNIYRPIRNITYALEYRFWKLNPRGYHLSNIVLHTLCGAALYFLIMLLLTYHPPGGQRVLFSPAFMAFFSALIFITHPVHTEVVAWIKGRDDLLSTLFFFLGFICYIRYRNGQERKKPFFTLLALFSTLLALFSKEMAITFPLMIFFYDLYFCFSFQKILKKYLIDYLPFILLSVFYAGIRTAVIGRVAQTGYWGGSPVNTFLIMSKGFFHYVRLLFFPFNLSPDYMKLSVSSIFDPGFLFSLFILVVLLFCLFRFYSSHRLLSFALLWFFVTLLPVSGIIPIKISIAERFLYLPSVAFSFFCPVLMMSIAGKNSVVFSQKQLRSICTVLLVVSCGFMAGGTITRNRIWKTDRTLWADAVKKDPSNDRAFHNLGVGYNEAEEYEKAMEPLLKAAALREEYRSPPRYIAATYYNIGFTLYHTGNLEGATKYIEKALLNDSDNPLYHMQKGLILLAQGFLNEAFEEYKRSIVLDPAFSRGFGNIGSLYMTTGDYTRAKQHLLIAVRIDPDYFEALYNLGMIAFINEDYAQAADWLEKAVLIPHTTNYLAHYGLGLVYREEKQYKKAEQEFLAVLSVQPAFADARYNLEQLSKAREGGR